MVARNNNNGKKLVSINFKGTIYSNNNVSSVIDLITVLNTYNVIINYDTNGYVETIKITQ